ncbi:MAG: IS21 family transposase [Candidatus Sericytochromatia bacterium]|nr:IS21 family transposase [Candidatus Tanganyikabacteria bacterium]
MIPMVTDTQVLLYRRKLKQGMTREAAAASSGMTAKTSRKWEVGPLPSARRRPPRAWRTREDPFDDVWDREVVPMLKADETRELQAVTVFEVLCDRYPDQFKPGQLRTLQRRIRDWRAVHGPEKEVFFEQQHPPGREAQFDFTDATDLGVTIAGIPFDHKLFEFVLSFSKWRYVELAFGETYEAMLSGIQGAVWALGGTTAIWRSDNLSAATHQLKETGGRGLTERYRQLTAHYGVESTRINAGLPHENGVAEKHHDLLKNALRQALIVRGSSDFLSVDTYKTFLDKTVQRLNKKHGDLQGIERPLLRPLPCFRIPAYTDVPTTVRKWSCIRVAGHTYSVASRLIGHVVTARVHPDEVEILFRDKRVDAFPRLRGQHVRRIDYRHLVHSLIRKAGAFANYRYREDLFPALAFRRAYDAFKANRGTRAELEYVRVLHLAATTMECDVQAALEALLETGSPFDYADVQALVASKHQPALHITPLVPPLADFDGLLSGDFHAHVHQAQTPISPR